MSDRPRQCGSDRQNDNELVFEREFRCERVVTSRAVWHRLSRKIYFKQSCFSHITCQSKKKKKKKKQLLFNSVSLVIVSVISDWKYANNREECNDVRHVNKNQWNNTRRSFEHRGIGKSADVRKRFVAVYPFTERRHASRTRSQAYVDEIYGRCAVASEYYVHLMAAVTTPHARLKESDVPLKFAYQMRSSLRRIIISFFFSLLRQHARNSSVKTRMLNAKLQSRGPQRNPPRQRRSSCDLCKVQSTKFSAENTPWTDINWTYVVLWMITQRIRNRS